MVDDHVIYQVVHAQALKPLDAAFELQNSVKDVVETIGGRLVASEPAQFDAGGGQYLPARTFSAESEKLIMRGQFIVDGIHMYGIAVAFPRDLGRDDAWSGFMQSFRLSPRQQH